ncbi:MAG: bifunctional phosphoribosyl-AMP cyclohydrolase/phosphoribosyl-ATP diphosphatase HisIE [Dehalococcoidia bacterium]|nr:bifunctional phosphoribosyl-AMP cyclohydrolase/phosphoribosyl-ATP diphosphatase HisIE [Dehalococcoidia bacterium]
MITLDAQGLVPAIAQDANTGQVLMLGYVSPGSLSRTVEGGEVWFYSRSRSELWHKGETSGSYLKVRSVWKDCDGDALLIQVEPTGPACHTGNTSCFFETLEDAPRFQRLDRGSGVLEEVYALIQDRKETLPEGSYTARLFQEGVERIAQKVIEEAGETALAAATGNAERVPLEAADLVYHLLVLLAAQGVAPERVWEELRKRRQGQG